MFEANPYRKTASKSPEFSDLIRRREPGSTEQLKTFVQTSAERILAVAHLMGNPLGLRALEPEDKSDVSNRSEQRYVTGKAKDVTEALCQIVFPAIDLDRSDDGTRYDDTAFLDFQRACLRIPTLPVIDLGRKHRCTIR